MPVSRKRKIENKNEERKHIDVAGTKGGKLLILILCISMVIGILAAAVLLMVEYLG